MNIQRIFSRLLPSLLTGTTILSGCSFYYESKAEDMVQRQMDAMVFVEGGEFMMGNPGGWSVRSDTIPVHRVVLDDFYIHRDNGRFRYRYRLCCSYSCGYEMVS